MNGTRMTKSAATIVAHRVAWRLVCAEKAKNITITRQRVSNLIFRLLRFNNLKSFLFVCCFCGIWNLNSIQLNRKRRSKSVTKSKSKGFFNDKIQCVKSTLPHCWRYQLHRLHASKYFNHLHLQCAAKAMYFMKMQISTAKSWVSLIFLRKYVEIVFKFVLLFSHWLNTFQNSQISVFRRSFWKVFLLLFTLHQFERGWTTSKSISRADFNTVWIHSQRLYLFEKANFARNHKKCLDRAIWIWIMKRIE